MRRAVLLLLLVLIGRTAWSATAAESAWFTQSRLGMFIHWGPYSLKGIEASWPLFGGNPPRAEYEATATQFNPTKFDARAIARLAKRAGMGYVILTSKHHDGFAMFDTKLSDYSIMRAPYGRDICRIMAEACRAEGLRFGFYFSLCDWHHPDYMTAPMTGTPGPGMLPQQLDPARWERFVEFMHGQVRELCSNYGRLDVIWFDGAWEHTAEQWKSQELHEMIRRLQPGILINDRGGGRSGDYATPEQTVPANGRQGLWETCMTINGTWAYNPSDQGFKSADDLLTVLAKTSSGGGNLLLNIGPRPTGEVQPEFVQRLEAIGAWMGRNGASVRGVQAGPRKISPENAVAAKPRRLYIHLLQPPKDGRLVLQGFANPVVDARLLSGNQVLPVTCQGKDAVVDLGGLGGDLKHEVVALRFTGDLEDSFALAPGPDGIITLPASAAMAHGEAVCYQEGYDDLGCWWGPQDWVSWRAKITQEGNYRVVLSQGAPLDQGGSFVLTVGEQTLAGNVRLTGSWTKYEEVALGPVHLKPGAVTVSIRPVRISNYALMNLKWVRLAPVGVRP
jgi:alpha-L-fucosidase